MGDTGDDFRAMREHRKQLRARLGVDCSGCVANYPKRIPSVLLPEQRCRVCGHRDPRPRQS